MSRTQGAGLAVHSWQRRDSSFSSHLVASLSPLKSLMEIHHSPSLGVTPAVVAWGCLHGRTPALRRRTPALRRRAAPSTRGTQIS